MAGDKGSVLNADDKKVLGCNLVTFVKFFNMVLGILIVFFGITSFLEVSVSNNAILVYSFKIYEILFGTIMVISLCKFNFINKHFRFLETVVGKGFFNIFLASMFLVGNEKELYGYLMFGGLLACGLFFVLLGCACIKSSDYNKNKPNKSVASRNDKLE